MKNLDINIKTGRLGKDPIINLTHSKVPVVNINIAQNKSYLDDKKDLVKVTEWQPLVFWNQKAVSFHDECKKGDLILVQGPSRQNRYINNNGEIIIESVIWVEYFKILERLSKKIEDIVDQRVEEQINIIVDTMSDIEENPEYYENKIDNSIVDFFRKNLLTKNQSPKT